MGQMVWGGWREEPGTREGAGGKGAQGLDGAQHGASIRPRPGREEQRMRRGP